MNTIEVKNECQSDYRAFIFCLCVFLFRFLFLSLSLLSNLSLRNIFHIRINICIHHYMTKPVYLFHNYRANLQLVIKKLMPAHETIIDNHRMTNLFELLFKSIISFIVCNWIVCIDNNNNKSHCKMMHLISFWFNFLSLCSYPEICNGFSVQHLISFHCFMHTNWLT